MKYNTIKKVCNDLKAINKELNRIKTRPLTKIISFDTEQLNNCYLLSVRVAQYF